jgi:CRISPR-associated protein Cmr5
MPDKSLEQQRAEYAWGRVRACPKDQVERYATLAKGAPALVMGNGLMQALAFWQSRKEDHAKRLVEDVHGRLVIACRSFLAGSKDFESLMPKLQQCTSEQYMLATEECLETLRWIRQFADAVTKS